MGEYYKQAADALVGVVKVKERLRDLALAYIKEVASSNRDPDNYKGWITKGPNGVQYLTPPIPPLATIQKMPPKKGFWNTYGGVAKRVGQVKTEAKVYLKRLQRGMTIKPPVTETKILRVMKSFDIPEEIYVYHAIDILSRKYLSDSLGKFVEKIYPKFFYNTPPPFKPTNRTGIVWDVNFKELMQTSVDANGVVIKRPTFKLESIIKSCSIVINGAYGVMDNPPSESFISPEELFINRVKRFSLYAEVSNNISSHLNLNASSLIFYYFKKTHPDTPFTSISTTLANTDGSTNVEDVLLKYIKDNHRHLLSQLQNTPPNVEKIIGNPYNVVELGGYPYSQISASLKSEYILLKILFWMSRESGSQSDVSERLSTIYRKKYERQMLDQPHTYMEVNNVLQLFPGLLTLMFYILNTTIKDKTGISYLRQLNQSCILLTTMKDAGGKYFAIERHIRVSQHLISVGERFLDLISSNTIKYSQLRSYISTQFLCSGFFKGIS